LSSYLPVIIGAVLVVAILLWWLLPLGGTKKKTDSAPKDITSPPAAVSAPPAAPVVNATAQVSKQPKAPAKTAATKKANASKTAAPKAAAKPVAEKAKSEKAPKVKAEKAKAQAAPKAKAAKPAAAPSVPENLELIKGLGPKVNTLLKGLGVTSFAQVASWTAADVADIDAKLGTFAGRITRDNWIDQAKLLAAGDIAGFEKKYGALGSGAKS
jgi:hypothetical protein